MNQHQKDLLLMDEDEIYEEAKKRIKECREKGLNKLDFSCLRLTKIPPEISQLKTLTELDIRDIEMKKIPAFIGEITSLKKLSLGQEYSGLYEENEKISLHSQLGNLRNLQNLSLGYGISEIPGWVFGLENLEALSIYNDTIETIPAEIANLKKLCKLRVYGKNITSLPNKIGEQLDLTSLDIKCPALQELPESFANLKTMKSIRFNDCGLSAIPGFIYGWTELEYLEINIKKRYYETNIPVFSSFSPEDIELTIIKKNQGQDKILETIPKEIGNLKNLKHFYLYGISIDKIPDSIGNCPLQSLSLEGSFKMIPASFANLQKLQTLQLSSDRPLTLPDSFGNLCKLKELEINAPALEIPPSFGKLASLEKLEIDTKKNLILPKTIGGLTKLKEFLINSCEMQSIPSSIGECKNLKYFHLASDKLSFLPESFCNLKKLEELHLDTFTLKELPADFGSLCALKHFDIFSGSLTALPESICQLKNLSSFNIDAFNVKKLPTSFNLLSYIKQQDIKIGSEEQELLQAGKKNLGADDFSGLADMSYRYCRKFLETCSLKKLEMFLCSAPCRCAASEAEKDVFKWIMTERRHRLNKNFKWTDENKKRMEKVSDEFLKAWEDSFAKAQKMFKTLNPAGDETIDIVLYPCLTGFKDDLIYSVITEYLDSEAELSMHFRCDQLVKEKDAFTENTHVSRKLSWNIEGLGDLELEDCYICYALHILYSHKEWAFEDMLKISSISTEIRITCDSGEF